MPGAWQLKLFDEQPDDKPDAAGRTRLIQLDARVVQFRFRRTRRRTIAVSIDAAGLSVSAPHYAPWVDIEAFMREKSRWILAKLDEWTAAGPPQRIHGVAGEQIPYWGTTLQLEVHAGAPHVLCDGERLWVQVRNPGNRSRVRAELARWLKGDMLKRLAPRAAEFAARLNFPPPAVSVSHARTQWGVCMEDGRIRLSWRLVHLPPPLADYVVAHEVAHLVELNHSPRFWALLETLYPGYREARRELDLAAAALPVF